MSYLSIKGLSVSLGGRPVLKGLDLELARGETLSLLGQSGAGKTTLLRVLAGFERAASGIVSVDGCTWSKGREGLKPEERNCGFVFQDFALFSQMTIRENVQFGIHELSSAERASRVKTLLKLVELDGLESRNVRELSGGQRQRVALARALAPRPKLLLLDEPFSQVDRALKRELVARVKAVLSATEATAICVLHQAEDASQLSSQIAVLSEGTLCASGTPEEVFAQPKSLAVARMLGDYEFLEAQAEGGSALTQVGWRVRLAQAAQGRIKIALHAQDLLLQSSASGGVWRVEERVFGASGLTLGLLHLPTGMALRVPAGEHADAALVGTSWELALSSPDKAYYPISG